MDDFEDYLNFLAFTFSGQGGGPKITHYMVWNEVGSGAWFDTSPGIPVDRVLTGPELVARMNKYAAMLMKAHVAIQRHTSGVLIHAVIDELWNHDEATAQVLQTFEAVVDGQTRSAQRVHVEGIAVLEQLWSLIGLSLDWSVSIHPYTEPSVIDPDIMNFANVPELVAFQNNKLTDRGVTPSLNRAQERIFASELNWTTDPSAVCRAHNISAGIPNLIGYTPFMHITKEEHDGSPDLVNYPFFQSTNPDFWRLRNDHQCCQTQALGCIPPWQQVAPSGVADVGMGADGSVWVIATGGSIYRRTGSTWQIMPGAASRIDVGPDGSAWIVNNLGQIFHWVGSTWQALPGGASDIGVGADGTVWIIGTDYGIYRWTGSSWQQVPGGALRIDVGPNGNPWVVNGVGMIYRWTGTTWENVAGSAQDVSVAPDGSVIVAGGPPNAGDQGIYRRSAAGGSFLPIVGVGTQVSVGAASTFWVVQASGALYTR